jgi:hypothetical protein
VHNSATSVAIGSFSPYSTELSTHLSPFSFSPSQGNPARLAHMLGREGKGPHYFVIFCVGKNELEETMR